MTKNMFLKGCACLDDNLKSVLPIHMKFGKKVYYFDFWKSLTFGNDLIQNG